MIAAPQIHEENTITGYEHLQTNEMLEAVGQDFISALTRNRLGLGYLCLEATKETRYGEEGLKAFANLIGATSHSQLYTYRRVAACFSPDESRAWLEYPVMQWSHLAAATILHDKNQREAFLGHCLDQNVSTTQAHAEARKWRGEGGGDGNSKTLLYDGDDLFTARQILADCHERGLKVMVKITTAE